MLNKFCSLSEFYAAQNGSSVPNFQRQLSVPSSRVKVVVPTSRCAKSPNSTDLRQSRILQSMQHTQGDTKERELLKCVVAVKECICGGGRHLRDVISKH